MGSRDADKLVGGCFLAAILFWLVAVGAVIFVVAHFIMKVW